MVKLLLPPYKPLWVQSALKTKYHETQKKKNFASEPKHHGRLLAAGLSGVTWAAGVGEWRAFGGRRWDSFSNRQAGSTPGEGVGPTNTRVKAAS
jgi:hypothetical protein